MVYDLSSECLAVVILLRYFRIVQESRFGNESIELITEDEVLSTAIFPPHHHSLETRNENWVSKFKKVYLYGNQCCQLYPLIFPRIS